RGLLEQVLDDARVRPGEEPVQIAHLRVERVVALGPDRHHGGGVSCPDATGQALGLSVGQRLAVAHAEPRENLPAAGGNAHARYHEGAEAVAMAALIGPDGASRCLALRPSLPPPACPIRCFLLPCNRTSLDFNRTPPCGGRLPRRGSPVDERRGEPWTGAAHDHPPPFDR